ncbi:MAG: glycosyltransferase family 9 protein [Promethearchaeota archaeon]
MLIHRLINKLPFQKFFIGRIKFDFKDSTKTTVFVMLYNLGDIVIARSTINAYKIKNPGIKVILITSKQFEDILRGDKFIDRIIYFKLPQKLVWKHFFQKRLVQYLKVYFKKAKIINLHIFPAYSGNLSDFNKHITEIYCQKANVRFSGKLIPIKIPENYELKAKDLFKEDKINLIISYSTSKSKKNWGINNFKKLGEIIDKNKYNVIFVGISPSEEIKVEKARTVYNKSILLVSALIKNCDLFIGQQSGLTHIASCFNKKIISLSKGEKYFCGAPLSDTFRIFDLNKNKASPFTVYKEINNLMK